MLFKGIYVLLKFILFTKKGEIDNQLCMFAKFGLD